MKSVMSDSENFAKFCHDMAGDLNILDGFLTLLIHHPSQVSQDIILSVRDRLSHSIDTFRDIQGKICNKQLVIKESPRKMHHDEPSIPETILRNMISEREGQIHCDLVCATDEIPPMGINNREFQGMMNTLFDNAVDAQAALLERHCEIFLAPEPKHLVIKFKDFGHGIPLEYRKSIFDRSFTTKARGSGYGLYYVKLLLERAGGEVEVSSVEGQETTFSLRIPYEEPALSRMGQA
jgi:signal transduction histidine kinase